MPLRIQTVFGCFGGMLQFLQYWAHCVRTGWEIGDGIFGSFVEFCLLVSAGLFLFKKVQRKHWQQWEEFLMRKAFHAFWISFVVTTFFIAPFLQFHDSDAVKKKLSLENSSFNATIVNLQRNLDKDESVLKAVAIIAGITNGNLAGNLEKIPSRLDQMQHDIKDTKDALFAHRIEESFSFRDTNRVTIFTEFPNHGPIVFFRLKHTPIKGSVQGIAQGPLGNSPLVGVESQANILWVTFAELSERENFNFIFNYASDIHDTNNFKTVWTNNGQIFLDNTHLILHEPSPDE